MVRCGCLLRVPWLWAERANNGLGEAENRRANVVQIRVGFQVVVGAPSGGVQFAVHVPIVRSAAVSTRSASMPLTSLSQYTVSPLSLTRYAFSSLGLSRTEQSCTAEAVPDSLGRGGYADAVGLVTAGYGGVRCAGADSDERCMLDSTNY